MGFLPAQRYPVTLLHASSHTCSDVSCPPGGFPARLSTLPASSGLSSRRWYSTCTFGWSCMSLIAGSPKSTAAVRYSR